ncbi:uncharacterized protein [Montipora capricornis]|uniref:uncharacterized protein n=1 Tax=Montipora capricornis TaxID=246305 RepID=UPI0035F11811
MASETMKGSHSIVVDKDSAERFLRGNGFEDLLPILVEKNKFHTVHDLKLLADNVDIIKNLGLPLCTILKLKAVLMEMEQENEDNSTKSQPKVKNMKEMAKKELCKANLSAQAANHAWNKFNNLINNKVKSLNLEGKWKGSGGLKACPGTTEEDSRVNLELCKTILQDPDIKSLYGVYKVEGAGQVTLDKTKGRKHISNIMCSSRKPSAYQKQCSKDSSRKRACKGKAEVLDKNSSSPQCGSKTVFRLFVVMGEGVPESNDSVPSKVQKVDLQTEVDRYQAIIVALHYLRAKKVSDVTLKKLKPLLKRYCVSCMKDSAKMTF